MATDLPKRPTLRLRLQEAVAYWQANTPAVANAVPQRHKSHAKAGTHRKAGEVTYLLPPPTPEFADKPESDPNIIALRKVAAAEEGRDIEVDVVWPDSAAVAAMHEFDCKLSEAVYAGKVKMFGRRDDQISADEPIPVGYCVNPRGFFRGDGQIDPHPHPIDDKAIFEQAMSYERIVWREVQIEHTGYVAWLAAEYSSTVGGLRNIVDNEINTNTAATGKRPLVESWLRGVFNGKPVPGPSYEPRKALIGRAINELKQLGGKLDAETMKKAIEAYNQSINTNPK